MVMVVMHIFGFLSGAHANPCVSISCYFMGYLAYNLMVMYVACQVLGAGLGYFLLMLVLPQEVVDQSKPAVCLREPMESLTTIQIVGIECLLTSVYVLGCCAFWDVRNGRYLDSVSLRMGLLVTVCSFAGVQLTGASMNPVKTLVPSLFLGNPALVWMQLTGQILASIMVPIIWQSTFMPRYRPLEMPI
ncbi:aquaporin-2 isoform X2 [Drosophila serrata]|nr:aquaporin-2 isoform X2 [Drosophila serrata]